MATWHLEIDENLDRVRELELASPAEVQERWRKELGLHHLVQELGLEGITHGADDVERALSGSQGRDWVDGRHLAHVRSVDRALREAAALAASLTASPSAPQFITLAETLQDGEELVARRSDGATEQYKHDTVPPRAIPEEQERLFKWLEEHFYTRPPLLLAVEAHHRHARLWPWETGSGIISRLLANVVLQAHGYPPAVIPVGMRQPYYQSLHYDIRRLEEVSAQAWVEHISRADRFFSGADEPGAQ